MPLSSHTNRIGTGRCWYAVHAAVLIAPVAVEWLADASPNVHAMIASLGTLPAIPSRDARSSDTAAPTALGRCCLLYTSDAADERSSVDLGGRRIIKKKKKQGASDGIETNSTRRP